MRNCCIIEIVFKNINIHLLHQIETLHMSKWVKKNERNKINSICFVYYFSISSKQNIIFQWINSQNSPYTLNINFFFGSITFFLPNNARTWDPKRKKNNTNTSNNNNNWQIENVFVLLFLFYLHFLFVWFAGRTCSPHINCT